MVKNGKIISKEKVPAKNFVGTILANVDNLRMFDADFRQFIRNTLPVVEKPALDNVASERVKESIKKYY